MKFKALPAVIAALLSSHSLANDIILEPIVINADFRPAEIQKTPISITNIDSLQIQDRGAQHLEDVLNMAPNVNMSSGGSRSHYFQIRGIGERSQFKAPINPSVGLIIDDIDFSRSGGTATLFDLEQVEVLRGPQGTRFGANALAGVINLRSKEATNELDIHFEATAAEYDTFSTGIAVGGPLIKDKLLGRVALHMHKSDGYMDNSFLNREDTNKRDEVTLRTHLKWLATDDLTLSLHYLHLNVDNGYDAFTFHNNRTSQSDQPGDDIQKTHAFSLRSDWDISNQVRLESIVTYSNSNFEYSFDEDWSYAGQFDEDLSPYSSFDQYLRDRDNHSIEFRLLSNDDGRLFNNTTDWLIGFYHAGQDEDLNRNYTYLSSTFTSTYDTNNTALFGQLDSALTDKLTLITGLRVEFWDAEYRDSEQLDIESDDTLFGGKLGLNYQFNDDHLLYTSLSRGYKAGGVNTDGSLPANARDFETEYLWNVEAGIKSLWLDGSLKTNLALFYAKRKNQQVKSSLLTARDDGSTEFIDYLSNAAQGKNMGLEAEADWLVNSNWRLFANLGILRATFDEYNDPDGIEVSGRRQSHAPNYQYAAGTEVYIGQNLTLRANVEGKDDFYFSDRHNAKSNAYALVNAGIEYTIESWRINLWGRNLFDKEYAVRGFGSFGNNPGNEYTTETYIQKGEPRVVGVTVSYDY